MARAFLDVTPDLLLQLPALLPRGINIFGAKDKGGVLRLVLEGQHLPNGKQLNMIITEDKMKRTIELVEVEHGQVSE